MKKVILSLLMVLLLTGCSPASPAASDKPTIVCTGFSQYDWVLNILGNEANDWNVIRINEKGADMHSYQPSAQDMINMVNADLIVYTGGVSEDWIVEVIEENPDFTGYAYCLLDEGDAKEEITVDGMFSKGHDHDHDHEGEEHHHDEDCELDEHIWLSLHNAKTFCQGLADVIEAIDPEAADVYEDNAKDYVTKLDNLDTKYHTALAETAHNTLIFADRFPFRYLADDYRLGYFAAFPGCSAETEASFDTIIFLAEELKEHNLPALLITESSLDSMAKTIIKTSDMDETQVLRLNSLQSITDGDATYLGIMEQNLEVLKTALN